MGMDSKPGRSAVLAAALVFIFIGAVFTVSATLVWHGDAEAKATRKIKMNPFEGEAGALKEGAEIFSQNCAVCHGMRAEGKFGPSLIDSKWKYGSSDAELFETVSKGRPGGMPNFIERLGKENIWKAILHVKSLGGIK